MEGTRLTCRADNVDAGLGRLGMVVSPSGLDVIAHEKVQVGVVGRGVEACSNKVSCKLVAVVFGLGVDESRERSPSERKGLTRMGDLPCRVRLLSVRGRAFDDLCESFGRVEESIGAPCDLWDVRDQ